MSANKKLVTVNQFCSYADRLRQKLAVRLSHKTKNLTIVYSEGSGTHDNHYVRTTIPTIKEPSKPLPYISKPNQIDESTAYATLASNILVPST
jgi:hypothetical protein